MAMVAFQPKQREKLEKKLDSWLSRTAQPRKPSKAYQQTLEQLYCTHQEEKKNDRNSRER